VEIHERTDDDRAAVEEFLAGRDCRRVARLGELVFPLDYPALVAEDGGRIVGVLTYIPAADGCEILTLHAATQWSGTGTALVDALVALAREKGCCRLWVVTTNDNVGAMRFYQRRGFRLEAVHAGAVDEARRTLKPDIPERGYHGITIRDEIELVYDRS
jgi:GNAT superfamily N-acetyltransferase